ncbi:ABC transporter ATP-binding protein [Candidatus Entotheonella serta]|nr:ABC transporter ATP-binding protein [Candidatus Entotheonella serta]
MRAALNPREILKVVNLSKRFDDIQALTHLNFVLEGPQLIGILGPNGAGKTTLLDILEGLSQPSEGEVYLFGATLHPYPKTRIGVVMQKEFLLEHVTTWEYAQLFAAIYGVPEKSSHILEQARLQHRRQTPITRLSGGEAARLFIAAATVHDPELLFLDAPTAHLDPANKRLVGQTLKEMSRVRTVLLTTHDLREAEALCDYLLFLVDGRVKAQGALQSLLAAVPAKDHQVPSLEDAFFHFCAVTMHNGTLQSHQPMETDDG